MLTSEVALNQAREKVTERNVSEIEKEVAAEWRINRLEKKRHESVPSQTSFARNIHRLAYRLSYARLSCLEKRLSNSRSNLKALHATENYFDGPEALLALE